MKYFFIFYTSLILNTQKLSGQKNGIHDFSQLEQRLKLIGHEKISSSGSVVIVSNTIGVDDAKKLEPSFDKWGIPITGVDFVFSGNVKSFRNKMDKGIFENERVFLDKKGIWAERMGNEIIMEVYHFHNEKMKNPAAS